MKNLKNLLNREPAVIIGVVAAAILAATTSLAGNDVIGADLAATLEAALSPESGWALPIIIGIVTRFFVYSPAKADELLHTPPPD
jgi:hypothetical protein